MSSFENLRVVDNFYQTSLFFPMPTVVISTLCELITAAEMKIISDKRAQEKKKK